MEILTDQKAEHIEQFYEARYHRFFIQVARFISKNGGTLQHAEDIYHDALIVYYEKSMRPEFKLHVSEGAYIMGTVKNLWSQRIKQDFKIDELVDGSNISPEEVQAVDQKRLYRIVSAAGKKCLDMLTMFYHQQCTLSHIAAAVGLGSEHSAAVQKYKCLEKIRETIKKNSLHHEDFFE